ncbi:MAG: hypothetical protein NT016_03315 [Candidatus Aenigmarchaeota archaeon]|nr:hypothetical protein [Candidatus Aenigmarchaeota archaeon]
MARTNVLFKIGDSSSEVCSRQSYVEQIRIKDNGIDMILDTSEIIDRYKPDDSPNFDINFHGDKVSISWENRDKKGRPLNKQNQPRKVFLEKAICFNEKLGEELGLYFGDGTKNDISCVEFSNFSPELILRFIAHMSEFGVKSEDLHFGIKLSKNSKIKYGLGDEEIKSRWRNALKLRTDKNINISWLNTPGEPSSYLQKYGTCSVRYFNSPFGLFYNSLINSIPDYVETNPGFRTGFIRGVIAADGNINTRKNGSLSLVRIAGSKDERKYLMYFLKKFFGIISKEDKNNQIYFGGIEKVKKIKNFQLHMLHPDKRESFERGYGILLNNLSRKPDEYAVLKNKAGMRIMDFLENAPTKTKHLIENMGVSRDYVKMIMNGYRSARCRYKGLVELGMVSVVTNPARRCEKIWTLTEKGKAYLQNCTQK